MRGKQCKKLRLIAKKKATSWKEVTLQGIKRWKIDENTFVNPNTINIKNNIFYQRKLDSLSIGNIVKKFKKLLKNTAHNKKKFIFDEFKVMV